MMYDKEWASDASGWFRRERMYEGVWAWWLALEGRTRGQECLRPGAGIGEWD
jgi:hypothetical protein